MVARVLRHFPQWFAAFFALIYFSGYLIDFFYYSSLGIPDPGSEPLKLHDIQIGLVFFLGNAIVIALLVFLVFGFRRMYGVIWRDERRLSKALASIMTITFTLSLYVATIFPPPQYFQFNQQHLYDILKLIGNFTIGLILLAGTEFYYFRARNRMVLRRKSKKQIEKFHFIVEIFRLLVILGIIFMIFYFDRIVFADLLDDLKEMFFSAGWTYFAFAVIFSLVLFRIMERLGDAEAARQAEVDKGASKAEVDRGAHKTEETHSAFAFSGILILGGTILLMFYFLSVFTYANTIFPYIPNAKGGADYTASPRSDVTLRPQARGDSPSPFQPDVIVLYTTSTTIFVSKYKLPNNPCKWRAQGEIPTIVAIMRREIVSIKATAAPSATLHPNCNVP